MSGAKKVIDYGSNEILESKTDELLNDNQSIKDLLIQIRDDLRDINIEMRINNEIQKKAFNIEVDKSDKRWQE